MGFEEFRLIPGFDIEKTPTLNVAGISDGAFVRWKEGLPEKLGGWARFFPSSVGPGVPRALHPWIDLNNNQRLAIGGTQSLKVLTAGTLIDITPQENITTGPPNFSTTSGSNVITIVDSNISNPTAGSFIFLKEQVSAGGIILFGVYQIQAVLGANTYTIFAAQNATATAAQLSPPAAPTLSSVAGGALGATTYFVKVTYVNASGETLGSAESSLAVAANNLLKVTSPIASGSATAYNVYVWTISFFEVLQTPTPIPLGTDWTEPTSGLVSPVFGGLPPINTTGGRLPSFTATTGSAQVTVGLVGHGLVAGQIAFFLDSTGYGGSGVISGNYTVQTPVTANTYTITGNALAPGNIFGFENAGQAIIVYFVNLGPQPTASGWGVGTYGTGTWGVGLPPAGGSGTPITATDWSLLNFGDILIANPAGQPLFQWNPESGQTTAGLVASLLGSGPITADGIILTQPQQIIIAWGATFNGTVNPMRLVWSDAGNFLQWVPSSTNFAGGFTIPRGSKIVACVQGPNQFTVHTDIGVWSGMYVGQPLVFAINEVMAGCGLVGRKALGVANTTIYWMSQLQLYQMAIGGVPSPLPSTVWDKVFQMIDKTNLQNVRFFANSQFNEIGWYFPVVGGNGENSWYIKYDTVQNVWDYGPLGRSAWIDQSILGPPIGGTTAGLIFQHEISPDADGVAMMPFILTGNFVIERAEQFGFLDYMIPDAIYGMLNQPQNANLLWTFFFRNFPNDTPVVIGPLTTNSLSTFVEPRQRGRLMQILIQGQDLGTWWRLGLMRFRIAPDGRNP
jgi:hypothetical protein